MAKDATMILSDISARKTQQWPWVTVTMAVVVWREESLWNVGVLKEYTSPVLLYFMYRILLLWCSGSC
jgi:hypothetical protein